MPTRPAFVLLRVYDTNAYPGFKKVMMAAHMRRHQVLVTCSIYQEFPALVRQQLQLVFQLFRL